MPPRSPRAALAEVGRRWARCREEAQQLIAGQSGDTSVAPRPYDQRAPRIGLAARTTALLAGVAFALVGSAEAAPATSIVGTWRGHLAAGGSKAPRQAFTITVEPGERAGTWRVSPTCSGTLRLKDISDGYHHYYRLGAKAGCAPRGIDCLQRAGARIVDVFVPKSGGSDSTGTFRRIG